LEIAFHSKELRALCEDEALAKRDLSPEVLEALKHRLADLRAAANGGDILVGRPRLVGGVGGERMAVDLPGKWQLVFAPNHRKNPTTASNTCNWPKVTRVKIMQIENCGA